VATLATVYGKDDDRAWDSIPPTIRVVSAGALENLRLAVARTRAFAEVACNVMDRYGLESPPDAQASAEPVPVSSTPRNTSLARVVVLRRLKRVPNNLVQFSYGTANRPLFAFVVFGAGVKIGEFAGQPLSLFLCVTDEVCVFYLIRKCHGELSLSENRQRKTMTVVTANL
jgi:hypothetical protein